MLGVLMNLKGPEEDHLLITLSLCTGKLDPRDPLLRSEKKQGFSEDPLYERARCWSTLGEIKT